MLNIFKSVKNKIPDKTLKTDIHSHLLPSIDDGSKSMEESIELIKGLIDLGFTKLIITPHVMQDYYPNSKNEILSNFNNLVSAVQNEKIEIKLEVSAEYYLDEFLLDKCNSLDNLILINNKYILFEMSFMDESPFLKEFIFNMKSKGITPILAHVERYHYYNNKISTIEDIKERGALLQINSISLTGFYGNLEKKQAQNLIDLKCIDLLGSDCHNTHQLEALKYAQYLKYYQKAISLQKNNIL